MRPRTSNISFKGIYKLKRQLSLCYNVENTGLIAVDLILNLRSVRVVTVFFYGYCTFKGNQVSWVSEHTYFYWPFHILLEVLFCFVLNVLISFKISLFWFLILFYNFMICLFLFFILVSFVKHFVMWIFKSALQKKNARADTLKK